MESKTRTAIGFLAIVSFLVFLLVASSLFTGLTNLSKFGMPVSTNEVIAILGVALEAIFFLGCSIVCYFVYSENEIAHVVNDELIVKKEVKMSIESGLVDAKYNVMISTLINRSRNKGYLNPELRVEDLIAKKMASGKTKEQAIEELYKQE